MTRTALPPAKIPHPHVTSGVDGDDSPVIKGTRIPVRRIYSWHRQGTTCETLTRRYPSLGWAQILDALAFAYDNLELITVDLIRERDELATALRDGPRT